MNAILRETETQLASMSAWRRWMVVAAAILMIATAGWYLWIDELIEKIDATRNRIETLEKKISANRMLALERIVAKLEKENRKLHSEIEKKKRMERWLQARARRLDIFLFDPERYMEIFEKILKRSVDLDIRIDSAYIQEGRGEISPLIDRWQRLIFEGSGSFAAVTRLTRYIESFKALQKITHYRYWYDKKREEPQFEMTILFYGASR